MLSILALESADSIRFLYRHFLSKITDKSLNAFYYACSYAKVDYSRFINVTASMTLHLVPNSLKAQPVFLCIDDTLAARAKCENEIGQLRSVIHSIDKQRERPSKQQELVAEITDAMNELINGVEYEDDFYKEILDKMVVNDKDHIDVYLNLLPLKWSYTVAKNVNCPQGKPLTGKHPLEASPHTERKKARTPEMEHFRGFSIHFSKYPILFKFPHFVNAWLFERVFQPVLSALINLPSCLKPSLQTV